MQTKPMTSRLLSQTLVGALVALVLLSLFSVTATAQTVDRPAAQATRTPTRTPASTANCIDVAKVTASSVNTTACVTGTVSSVSADSTAAYLKFKNTQFQVISYNLRRDYTPLKGQCIKATGTVKRLGTRLVLALGNTAITDCKGKAITLPLASSGGATGSTGSAATATPRPAATAAPPPTATPAPGGASGNTSGLGKVTVINESKFDVNFTLWGPSDQSLGAAAGQTATYQIPVGAYGWTSFLNGCQLVAVDNLIVATTHTVVLRVVNWEGECGANLFYGTQ